MDFFQTDYSYPSSHFAIQRYFKLLLSFRSPTRSMPLNPDDLISGTKMSTDSDGMIELQDLTIVMRCLTELEREVLKVEYLMPTMPIDGVIHGDNKCEAVFRLCGERLHGRKFLKIASEANGKVGKELQRRRWIPTNKALPDTSSMKRYARKSLRALRRSRVMRGQEVRSSSKTGLPTEDSL